MSNVRKCEMAMLRVRYQRGNAFKLWKIHDKLYNAFKTHYIALLGGDSMISFIRSYLSWLHYNFGIKV